MPNRQSTKLILIAEDDPDIGELIETVLESKGFSTKICIEGNEVLVQAKKLLPHLIIMDLWLPGIDGASLTKKLKSQKATKNIPVIIVSAQNYLAKVVKQTKANAFLSKPFNLTDLVSTVEAHIK